MADKLLVRSYNVGCGDCIYVRIPNDNDDFHILIDCGSKESADTKVMRRSIEHMESEMLPDDDATGKKRLDLIVVTHRHEDHIKGFNATFFKNIAIKNIWITAAMDESHEQAQKSLAIHKEATKFMQNLVTKGASLSPAIQELAALYGIGNTGATTSLTETLPAQNNIDVNYVFAGNTSDELGLSINDDTKIIVVAPEKDIDGFYLGEEADKTLKGFQAGPHLDHNQESSDKIKAESIETVKPTNISDADFRQLQSRLLSNGLAFAVDDSDIQNNMSTVILIEWKGKRLLFVGDAEWNNKYREGEKNSSWNVMWKERKDLLNKPIDFLKVGHHGSHNATPWNRKADEDHEVNQILNAILPLPANGEKPTAQCIVSTKRKQYDTIPDAELLVELGKRVSNTKNYLKVFTDADPNFDPEEAIFNYSVMKKYEGIPELVEVGDKGWLDQPQPIRTDLESAAKGDKTMGTEVEFIDVELEGD